MFKDQKEKIAYYRARITKDLIRKGIYPDDDTVKDLLDKIDVSLAILQYIPVKEGDLFDAQKVNEDIARVYRDLIILYQLVYDISIKQYEELRLYGEAHLNELQGLADKYRYKTRLETSATYIGNTIFYQNSGYNFSKNNNIITVQLGEISAEQQSKLSMIFDCADISQEHVVFYLTDKKTGQVYTCSPYDYNKDFFTVPGTLSKKTYTYAVKSRVRSAFICTPKDLAGKISRDHRYKLYGAKNCISLGYLNKVFAEKLYGIPVEFTDASVCTFWIIGGTYISFNFSEEPMHKNFEGYEIKGLSEHQKIVIEHNKAMSFDFVTDGTIYATHYEGRVQDSDLVYPALDKINDILIEDYAVGEKNTYDVKVVAGPLLTGDIPVINCIAIKQLSSLEEVL